MAGGQYRKGACPYAKECVDTLVGTITQPEFKGNMLVIMAGYEDPMDQMFASVNPGFASRFNKRRVHFLPWTATQLRRRPMQCRGNKKGRQVASTKVQILTELLVQKQKY